VGHHATGPAGRVGRTAIPPPRAQCGSQADSKSSSGMRRWRSSTCASEVDYVIFGPGIHNGSTALEQLVFLTVRWPSVEGDCHPAEEQAKA
jgi:hypothetical protein